MTDEGDERITALFEAAYSELPPEGFAAGVMARVREHRRRSTVVWGAICLVLLAGAWLAAPYVQSVSLSIAAFAAAAPTSLPNEMTTLLQPPLALAIGLPCAAYFLFGYLSTRSRSLP